MTAAQLRRLQEHDLLDLGAYLDGMRGQIAAHREKFGSAIRVYQASGMVRLGRRVGYRTLWLLTESLN